MTSKTKHLRPLTAFASAFAVAITFSLTPGASPAAAAPVVAPPRTEVAADPSPGCGTDRKSGNDEKSISSAGGERTYRLNVPRDYEPTSPMPLVIGFHGSGSDGAEFQNYTGIPRLPTISVFPDGVLKDGKRSWQGAPYASGFDDVRFVSDVLDAVEAEYCIDRSRVFATGKSNGGGMVSVLACRLPNRFAAFATVAGAYYPQSTAGCAYDRPTPMLAIHGTGDATMHYDGGTRQGETYPSVRDWIAPWAEAADCGAATERNVGRRGEKVLRTQWTDCTPGVDVELYSIRDGGHVWPGETMYSGGGYVTADFSATETIWDFFQRHPARSTDERRRDP